MFLENVHVKSTCTKGNLYTPAFKACVSDYLLNPLLRRLSIIGFCNSTEYITEKL